LSREVLDFRGEPCPAPLIKTIRKIANLEKGGEVIVLTDREDCVTTIRETLELLEIRTLVIERAEDHWMIRITK